MPPARSETHIGSRKLEQTTMQDVRCKQCGEPYSPYSLRNEIPEWDGEPEDAYEKFMDGEGCPTCNWSEKAGEVSTSRTKSQGELDADHITDIMENTDEDPIKYI